MLWFTLASSQASHHSVASYSHPALIWSIFASLLMLLQAAAVCPACVDLGSEHSHESAMCRICSTSPAFNGAHVRLYGCRFPAACYMFTAGPPLRQWRHMLQRPTTPGSTLFDAGWWLAGGVLSACAKSQALIILLLGRCCGSHLHHHKPATTVLHHLSILP